MGNKVRGEASFEHEGQTYNLVLDFNAFCEIEAARPEMTMPVLIQTLNVPKINNVRLILYGALFANHRLSLEEVGDLVASMGFEKALAVVEQLGAAFPKAKPEGNAAAPATGKRKGNSRKTGTAS